MPMLVPVPVGVLPNPLDRNGSITIIYRFIYQIPGKLSSTVRRKCYIIKLIRRVETIFRTGNNITCHHIIQTLEAPDSQYWHRYLNNRTDYTRHHLQVPPHFRVQIPCPNLPHLWDLYPKATATARCQKGRRLLQKWIEFLFFS